MNLAEIRAQSEECARALLREFYENGAGLKDELDTTTIYEAYSHLFTRVTIDGVQEKIGSSHDPEEVRRLRYLREFLIDGFMGQSVKELSDELACLETQSTVKMDGSEIPYRYSAVLLRNESNRARRGALEESRDLVKQKMRPLYERLMSALHEQALVLGYKNYAALYAEIKGIDLKALGQRMEKLLQETEKIYAFHLHRYLERLGIPPEDAQRHDGAFLFRAQEFDAYFPKNKIVGTLRSSLRGLGFDLDRQKNVKLDLEERPKKSPRAFCATLCVPHEVILVIMPAGGLDDYHATLHEAGHAEHFAHTSAREPFEYRYLGDYSVTESYAFLFNYLTTDGYWVEKYLHMDQPEDFLHFALFDKLHQLRRYAAKLLYELRLHSQGLAGMDEVYAQTLTKAVKFRYRGLDYLIDLDSGFYAAQYLRAWMLEVQLRRYLQKEIDRKWFLKKDSGDYLRELWACGQKWDATEMAQRIGYRGLDPLPLVSEFESGLRASD